MSNTRGYTYGTACIRSNLAYIRVNRGNYFLSFKVFMNRFRNDGFSLSENYLLFSEIYNYNV